MILFFNGPPGAGKDTIGYAVEVALTAMYPFLNTRMDKFAYPLKNMAKGCFGWDDEQSKYFMETQEGKATEIPGAKEGYTYRQLLIDFSEHFIKPRFSSEAFGQFLLERVKNKPSDFLIITDCGFTEELQPVIKHFGKENCLLIQVHRQGCDFKKDSRSYVSDENCHMLILDNNGSVLESVIQVLDKIQSIEVAQREKEADYYEQQKREYEELSSTWATSPEIV